MLHLLFLAQLTISTCPHGLSPEPLPVGYYLVQNRRVHLIHVGKDNIIRSSMPRESEEMIKLSELRERIPWQEYGKLDETIGTYKINGMKYCTCPLAEHAGEVWLSILFHTRKRSQTNQRSNRKRKIFKLESFYGKSTKLDTIIEDLSIENNFDVIFTPDEESQENSKHPKSLLKYILRKFPIDECDLTANQSDFTSNLAL